jgi:hypothetical protein
MKPQEVQCRLAHICGDLPSCLERIQANANSLTCCVSKNEILKEKKNNSWKNFHQQGWEGSCWGRFLFSELRVWWGWFVFLPLFFFFFKANSCYQKHMLYISFPLCVFIGFERLISGLGVSLWGCSKLWMLSDGRASRSPCTS